METETGCRLLQQAKERLGIRTSIALRIHNTSSDRSPDTIEDRLRTITGLLAENRALLLAAYSPLALVAAANEQYGEWGAHSSGSPGAGP